MVTSHVGEPLSGKQLTNNQRSYEEGIYVLCLVGYTNLQLFLYCEHRIHLPLSFFLPGTESIYTSHPIDLTILNYWAHLKVNLIGDGENWGIMSSNIFYWIELSVVLGTWSNKAKSWVFYMMNKFFVLHCVIRKVVLSVTNILGTLISCVFMTLPDSLPIVCPLDKTIITDRRRIDMETGRNLFWGLSFKWFLDYLTILSAIQFLKPMTTMNDPNNTF